MKETCSRMIFRILACVARWMVELLNDTEKHNDTMLTVKINWFRLRHVAFFFFLSTCGRSRWRYLAVLDLRIQESKRFRLRRKIWKSYICK